MELKRAGSQPSMRGPEDWFTGTMRIDPLNAPPAPARVSCAAVTFEPGARSAWHTHPRGQTLIVTAGCGWTQCEDGKKVEIRAGDVIWCPPGHKHWHGVIGLTKSAALEYAPRGVRINAICPGVINTPMVADMLETQREAMDEFLKLQPIGRLGPAEEIAAAVLWLCSPGASFIVGVALPVDGGFTAH